MEDAPVEENADIVPGVEVLIAVYTEFGVFAATIHSRPFHSTAFAPEIPATDVQVIPSVLIDAADEPVPTATASRPFHAIDRQLAVNTLLFM